MNWLLYVTLAATLSVATQTYASSSGARVAAGEAAGHAGRAASSASAAKASETKAAGHEAGAKFAEGEAKAAAATASAAAKKAEAASKAPARTGQSGKAVGKTAPREAKSSPAAEYRWTKVGADPCNPKVGCTLAWALSQTSWPVEVLQGLTDKVRSTSPETYTMSSGWRGWMTWGKYSRKFRSNTVAAWPHGQVEPADLWSFDYAGTRYNIVQVRKCKNWGGFTTSAPLPRPAAVAPPTLASPGRMPLGVIPVVACPEEND